MCNETHSSGIGGLHTIRYLKKRVDTGHGESVGESSGPVLFVSGSHRWGFLEAGDFFDPDIDKIKDGIKVPQGEVWNEIPAILPKSGLSIHHSLTYHGSGPNNSKKSRVSLVLHMRNESAKPIAGRTDYYISHLDDERYCPVIFEA